MPDTTPRLTPETVAKILSWIRRGHYRKTACAHVRITERTLQNWIAKGEEGIEPYKTFVTDLHQAEAECQDALLVGILEATKDDVWTNKAWVLERRWPRQWRGSVRIQVQEEVDSLTQRLREDHELYRKVVEKLTSEEAGSNGEHSPNGGYRTH